MNRQKHAVVTLWDTVPRRRGDEPLEEIAKELELGRSPQARG